MDKIENRKEVTINDLARELRVSKSTVSRALQDHHSIGEVTKQAVRELAQKYNYHPNAIAASLYKKSTNTIGVIVPILSHYFFSTAISGMEEIAYKAGYKVIICQSDESYEKEVSLTKTLLSAKVDGLIVSVSKATEDIEHFNLFLKKNIPLVFFDRLPEGIETHSVSADDYWGAYKVTEHLIEQGYKRIAHFTGSLTINLSHNRLRGYLKALTDHHLPVDEQLIIECGFERNHGVKAAEELLQRADLPDAIFCVSDPVAIGVMLTLKKQGIRIPQDIAVAGFNNDPTSTVIDPPLTTVYQPAFEIGAAAVDVFLNQVRGGEKELVKKVLPTKLLIRESSIKAF